MSADITVMTNTYCSKADAEGEVIETVVIDDTADDEPNTIQNNLNEIVEVGSDDDGGTDICEVPNFSLFDNIIRERGLLANVMEKCLELENGDGMERAIKKTLMRHYSLADKNFITSSKFNKALLNTLAKLETDPDHKFTHIKYLCDVLRSSTVKRRVNLITLQTNLKDKHCKEPTKRKINHSASEAKSRKLDIIEIEDSEPQVPEIIDLECSDVEVAEEKENKNVYNGSPYKINNEDLLLTPHKQVPYIPTTKEIDNSQQIAILETTIEHLHKQIQELEEKEVDDDSAFGSPYILSEPLKKKLVECYQELCKLTGGYAKKTKRIRLQVTEGHPPGPTKLLQRFINNRQEGEGFNFPDLLDVVTCVEQGLMLDGLSWTRAQILKEASALFTQCGRALQKCRQRREWKDLMSYFKEEVHDGDPADEDPELMAKLQLNQMVAVKREKDLLDKYARMQDLPTTARLPIVDNDTLNYEDNSDDSDDETDINYNKNIPEGSSNIIQHNNHTNSHEPLARNQSVDSNPNQCTVNTNIANGFIEVSVPQVDNNYRNRYSNEFIGQTNSAQNSHIESVSAVNIVETEVVPVHNNDRQTANNVEESSPNDELPIYNDAVPINNDELPSNYDELPLNNDELSPSNNDNSTNNEAVTTRIDNNTTETQVTSTNSAENEITVKEECKENELTIEEHLPSEPDVTKVKTEPTENIANQLESLGENYTVSIVDIEDPFLIIDISSDSDTDDDYEDLIDNS